MVRALQGQEETFEMYFRMELPKFPAATLPFPSAGDLRFRAQGMWVVRYPGCHPLRSFCPGLGSSCPFGTCASKCIVVQSFFLRQQRQRGQRNGAYMFNGVHFDRRGQENGANTDSPANCIFCHSILVKKT